jgi:hypothetical protein
LGVVVIAWERTQVARLCGRCNRTLIPGDPILVVTIARGSATPIRRVRCDLCEGPAPPDLPALVESDHVAPLAWLKRLQPQLPLGSALADWRARQAGDAREPGEEG